MVAALLAEAGALLLLEIQLKLLDRLVKKVPGLVGGLRQLAQPELDEIEQAAQFLMPNFSTMSPIASRAEIRLSVSSRRQPTNLPE